MNSEIVYITEKSVLTAMQKAGLKTLKMFITAYVDPSDNYQKFGFTIHNIDVGYYKQQNILKPETKTFKL